MVVTEGAGSMSTGKELEGWVPDLTNRLQTDLAFAGEDAGSGLVGYSTAATETHG